VPDLEKIQVVDPSEFDGVRPLVALASYYRKHIHSFAEIAPPLHELTKKNVQFHWGSHRQFFSGSQCQLTEVNIC